MLKLKKESKKEELIKYGINIGLSQNTKADKSSYNNSLSYKIFKYKEYILLPVLLFLVLPSFAQSKFSGRVVNSTTKEALAFVNVIYNSKNYGTTTDLNGYFTIDSYDKIDFLRVSCLGFVTKIITKEEIGDKRYMEIKLDEEAYSLSEVTILPGVNPAHRIIEEVIKNADKNNPEKVRSFKYTSYNRMHVTIDANNFISSIEATRERKDSLDSKKNENIQDIPVNQSDEEITDSIEGVKSFKDFFDSQHLFLSESISERKFRYPDNNKEVILAQRVSGLKNPNFLRLTSQLQSLSFYKDYIDLMNKKYLSPVSKGSTKRYFFQIEDTMYNEKADTIFIISYRPLKDKNFEGIQGVLHINSNGYAIQSVNAKPYNKSSSIDINIQQKHELIDGVQWFPVQLNTDIVMNMIGVSADSISMPVIIIAKSYLSDISINPDSRRRDFNQVAIDVKDDAHKKDEDFWNMHRKDSLTEKDLRTYEFIDSIGEEIQIDRIIDFIDILSGFNIPWKFINFDLKSIYWYNNHEGSRLGLGISTNDRLLRWVSLGGYFAYGFKDKAWKYGGKLDFLLNRPSDTRIAFGYKKDLEISDDFNFYSEPTLSLSGTIMDMFLDEMDSVTEYYTTFQFTTLKYLKARLKFSYSEKNITNPFRYDYIYPIDEHYFRTEAGIYLKYAFKEKFIQTPKGNRLSLGTKYPVLNLNIIKSLPVMGSEHDYWKFEAAVSKKFIIRNAGDLNIVIKGGMVEGIAPYSELYYGTGIRSWLNFDNTFNTMKINEFISDRFAHIFVRHNFGSLLWKRPKFAPEIVLVTAAGWGDSRLVGNLVNENYAKRMNKGYFESGIQINNLLTLPPFFGYGIGVYYRYGPYSNSKEIDNWAFKLSLNYKF